MRSLEDCNKTNYINTLFGCNNHLFQSIDDQYNRGIQISPHEAQFLKLLIRMNHINSVIEIGTLAGYSAICMAEELPINGKLYTIEKNSKHADIASDNFTKFNLSEKIQLLFGDALTQLKLLSITSEQFDMIFIDADKAGYPKYLDWAERHIKRRGLIVADNTFLFDSVFLDKCPDKISYNSWSAMKEFNLRLSDKDKYLSTLIPTAEGLTVAIKL